VQPSDLPWMNGDFLAWEDAKVHVLTHGLHYGTGVFEGIRAHDTELGTAVFRLPDHLERLRRSAELYYMPLPYPPEQLREVVHELIARNGLSSCYIRPLAFRGYGQMGLYPMEAPVEVVVAAWEWAPYLGPDSMHAGVRGKVSSWRRISPDALIPHAKAAGQYLNNVLAKIESQKAGYEEAILLDAHGNVCEGSGENIFIVRDGVIATPGQASGILEGINRRSAIQIARDLGHEVQERAIARAELYLADEVFVTGTATLQPVPVREIDDHTIGEGTAGPVTRRLQSVYEEVLRGRAERYREWLDVVKVPSRAA
jgi:branched-chain amino acid aminotransferase